MKKKKGTGLSLFRDLKLLAAVRFTVDVSNEQNVLMVFWLNLPDEKFIFPSTVALVVSSNGFLG